MTAGRTVRLASAALVVAGAALTFTAFAQIGRQGARIERLAAPEGTGIEVLSVTRPGERSWPARFDRALSVLGWEGETVEGRAEQADRELEASLRAQAREVEGAAAGPPVGHVALVSLDEFGEPVVTCHDGHDVERRGVSGLVASMAAASEAE